MPLATPIDLPPPPYYRHVDGGDSGCTCDTPDHKLLSIDLLAGRGLAGGRGDGGARIAFDLWREGNWTAGGIAAISTGAAQNPAVLVVIDHIDTLDTRALGYVAYTLGGRQVRLRASLGAGAVATHASAQVIYFGESGGGQFSPWGGRMNYSTTALGPATEAALGVDVATGAGWGIDLGMIATGYLDFEMPGVEGEHYERGFTLEARAGVRHRI